MNNLRESLDNPFLLVWIVPLALVLALFLLVSRFRRRLPHRTIKSFIEAVLFLALFLLGTFEVFYGVELGRAGVSVQQRLLSQDMQPPELTENQISALFQHFGDLKVQWGIVTCFGVATILFGVLYLMAERDWVTKNHNAEQSGCTRTPL